MKQGMTIEAAVTYLKDQQARKRDLIVPVRELSLAQVDGEVALRAGGSELFSVRPRAHEHLASFTKIPLEYYRRCLSAHPDMLVQQVNTWIGDKRDESDARMVRALDSEVRAVLSSRYRRVDSLFVLSRALDGLKQTGLDFRVESINATDERMHLKAIFPTLIGEPKVGDVVAAGVHVWDDEVGGGSWGVAPFSYRLICRNGATHKTACARGRHVGRNLDADDVQHLSQEAVDADDHALGLKIRDLVIRYGTDQFFQTHIVGAMREALGDVVAVGATDAKAVVEQLAKAQGFAQSEVDATLAEFLRAGDFTRYGLAQAVTFASQSVEDYERASALEEVGGELLVAARR